MERLSVRLDSRKETWVIDLGVINPEVAFFGGAEVFTFGFSSNWWIGI